jgi:hypothetical protein
MKWRVPRIAFAIVPAAPNSGGVVIVISMSGRGTRSRCHKAPVKNAAYENNLENDPRLYAVPGLGLF